MLLITSRVGSDTYSTFNFQSVVFSLCPDSIEHTYTRTDINGERYLGALILKPDLYDSDTEARLGGQRLSHLHVT